MMRKKGKPIIGLPTATALLRYESRQITSVAAARDALIKGADRLGTIAHIHRKFSPTLLDRDVDLVEIGRAHV